MDCPHSRKPKIPPLATIPVSCLARSSHRSTLQAEMNEYPLELIQTNRRGTLDVLIYNDPEELMALFLKIRLR